MKIGVISDSHDRLPTLRRAISMFVQMRVDVLLHAGDYVAPFAAKLLLDLPKQMPLHCIYGNNDGERAGLKKVLPQLQDGPMRLELGKRVVAMHHWIDWFKPDDIHGADVVISGHTHEVVNEKKGDTLFLNPGECCGWLTDRCTVALIDTDQLNAEIIEISP